MFFPHHYISTWPTLSLKTNCKMNMTASWWVPFMYTINWKVFSSTVQCMFNVGEMDGSVAKRIRKERAKLKVNWKWCGKQMRYKRGDRKIDKESDFLNESLQYEVQLPSISFCHLSFEWKCNSTSDVIVLVC